MKNTFLKTKYILLIFLVVLSFSCSSDGEQGPAGADGNANVMSSSWSDITWSNNNTTFGSFDRVAPEITQEDLDSSVILIYFKNGLGRVYLTPTAWDTTVTIGSYAELGNIRVYYYSDVAYNMPTDAQVKYLIIPSNTSKTNINFTKMSYQEVMDYFNLEY